MKCNLQTERHRAITASGFTLVELIAVMVIVSILLAIATPGFNGFVGSTRLRGDGGRFSAELARAQQLAVTLNHAVEVRFFRYPDPEEPESPAAWRAVQFFRTDEDPEGDPIGEFLKLNSWVVFSEMPHFSSLLTLPQVNRAVPGIEGTVDTVSFSFLPSGATNLPPIADSPGGDGWYVSLVPIRDEEDGVPAEEVENFITLQIDPHNGAVRSYQP